MHASALFGCSECVAARRTVYTQFFRCPEGVGSWRTAQSACRGSKLPRRCGRFATKSNPEQKSKVMRYFFGIVAISLICVENRAVEHFGRPLRSKNAHCKHCI